MKNKSSIKLHPKHGLNPTIPVCIVCGEDKGDIALLGATWKGKEAAPMRMLIDAVPCEDCTKKHLTSGVLLVENTAEGIITGKIAILTEGGFRNVFPTVEIPEQRIVVISEEAMTQLDELFASIQEEEATNE